MKRKLQKLFRSIGLDVRRFPPHVPPPPLARIIEGLGISVVFDVGANQGQFARQLRKAGFAGKIVSFEPTELAHQTLLENAADDERWCVHDRAAIGASAGKVKINVAANQAASSSILEMGELHKESAPDSAYVGVEEVSLTTIDSVFPAYVENNEPALLKIDVQGYEDQVLEGAQKSLQSFAAVKLELSLTSLYEGDKDYKFYVSALEDLGFEIWDLELGHRHPSTARLLQFDAVFVRSP